MTQDDTWLQPTTNELGMIFLPIVNFAGNELNNWTYTDMLMQSGINMYPGEEWCNLVMPHAKWHLETSIALTDFTFFLFDSVIKKNCPDQMKGANLIKY